MHFFYQHLRLHKYTELLGRLSYPELLSLTEEQLAGLGVTVGARRKILASVDRLQERPRLLASLGHRLEREGCDLREVRWNDKADIFSSVDAGQYLFSASLVLSIFQV